MAKAKTLGAAAKVTSIDDKRRVCARGKDHPAGESTGVLLKAVQHPRLEWVLAQAFKAKGEGLKADLSLEDLVKAAQDHWLKLGEDHRGNCDNCGGDSDVLLDPCPFCGDDGEGKVLPFEEPKAATKNESPVVDKLNAAVATGQGQALVKVTKPKDDLVPASQVLTEHDLDAAVARVHKAKGETAAGHWDVGNETRDIYNRKLWQLRLGADGKPKYKTWESFVAQELMMSHTNAKILMDVSEAYSREKVAALGPYKLGFTLTLPVEDRPRLLAAAEGGATKRQLAEEARRIKKEKGFRRPNRESPIEHESGAKGGKGGAKSQSGTTSKSKGREGKREEKITVAQVLGKTTLKMYKKPPSMRNVNVEELSRAKRFADNPFTMNLLANGVQEIFTLTEDAAGQWQLVIERRRVAD